MVFEYGDEDLPPRNLTYYSEKPVQQTLFQNSGPNRNFFNPIINSSKYTTSKLPAFNMGFLNRAPVAKNEALTTSEDFWSPNIKGTNLPLEDKVDLDSYTNEIEPEVGRVELSDRSVNMALEASENVFEEGTSIGGLVAGSAISAISSGVNSYENQKSLNIASQGNGPNGHAFDAMTHAQADVNTNNIYSDVRSGLITAGSLFGPEGLAVGVGLAAATAIPQALGFGYSDQNTTMANSGDMVNAASLQ